MCDNGYEQHSNGGVYFICKITGNACAFVRYCNVDNKLKPMNQSKCKNYTL